MTEHYFTARPTAPEVEREVRLVVDGRALTLRAPAGTFSADHLDPGTGVLLREAPPPPPDAATLLDLGCGWGPIACALALRAPAATVWAVDVNTRALAATAANAARHGLRIDARLPDDVPADVVFDEIWSNPPIRVGKPALHALLLTWLPRLAPVGTAYLVVARTLGADSLQRWLAEQGYAVRRLTSVRGYRVLGVRRNAP